MINKIHINWELIEQAIEKLHSSNNVSSFLIEHQDMLSSFNNEDA